MVFQSSILALATSFLLGLGAMAASLSADCTPKDLTSLMGKVRTQGNIGWCYANTAADLLSFKYREQWNGNHASAIFTALGYNFKHNSSEPGTYIFTEGGDIKAALNYAGEFGYSCPRQLDDMLVNGGFKLELRQKLHLAVKMKTLFDNRTRSLADLDNYNEFINQRREAGSILTLISDDALERALKLNINLAVVEMAKEICSPYKHKFPMTYDKTKVKRYFNDDTQFFDDVLQKWVYNQAPDMIKFLNHQLSNDNVVGVDYKMKLISSDLNDNDQHASVIVGREVRGNQCHYLIRNSWGPECGFTTEKGAYVSRYNKKVTCVEGGNVWVSETDLKANLKGIVYIPR